jgi:hypothetical protein
MEWQKFEQRYAIEFCVKLANPLLWFMKSYRGLMENIPYPGHKCSIAQAIIIRQVEDELVREDLQAQKRTTLWKQ